MIRLFKSLGRFIARAFIDSWKFNFAFNFGYFEAVRFWLKYCQVVTSSNDCKFLVCLLLLIDPSLNSSLRRLLTIRECYSHLCAAVENLCLSFVLPVYPDYELVEHGGAVAAKHDN